MKFCLHSKQYEFDGIDIDWDSPLDRDKGGSPDNFDRFVQLAKEIRSAFDQSGKDYTLSIALPPTDWELLDYDVAGLSEHVDWFNLMTFDYHTPKNIPKTVGAHTDLKLIDSVVFELVQEIASTKFVLGMAAYGRTYTLADDRCEEIGCPFRSPGLGGCGNTPGFLPFNEIIDFIESNSYNELHQDVSSSSMVAVVDNDQMISFDDPSTWAIKEAYAEMMCLRGTMLWSIDMLKATSPLPSKRRTLSIPDQPLSDSSTQSESIGISGNDLLGCNLCGNQKILSGATVDYAGSMVSCSELEAMLSTVFVPQESAQCGDLHTTYSEHCCHVAPSKSCDICDATSNKVILNNKPLLYAGKDTTCGDISDSLKFSTEEKSFTCSLAKTSLTNVCCVESCQMCNNIGEINAEAKIEFDGEEISCAEYESSMKISGLFMGTEECDASSVKYSGACCSVKAEPKSETSASFPDVPCNICQKGEVQHQLKSETSVEYKGTSISCVDVNTILSKSETDGSEMCEATQSLLFDGCCYEKCALCGERDLKFDATVKYNNQILSCQEFGALFSMSNILESSDQCDAIQSAYSSTCCFKHPKSPCNLCEQGSQTYDVIPNAFVKKRFATDHCVNILNTLAEREEDGSQTCKSSKAAYFSSCCDLSSKTESQPLPGGDNSYVEWLTGYLGPQSSGIPPFAKLSFWSFILTLLLGYFLSC